MAVSNLKVEHEFDEDIKPFFSHQTLIINDGDSFVTESNIANLTEVECHLFYPVTEPELEREPYQEDPLADTAEWTNCKQVSPAEELLEEDLPQIKVTDAFSLVDPIQLVAPVKSEPIWVQEEPRSEDVLESSKPSVVQLKKKPKKKRKASGDQDLSEVPSKKINVAKEISPCDVVFKELAVNIGPKLPECFLPKNESIASQTTNTNATSQELRCSSCTFTCEDRKALKAHSKEHVVLRIYTCSKCNHKCTNSRTHEDHVSVCLSDHSNTVLNQSIHNSTPRKGWYCCELCSFRFKNEQNLIVHENKHFIEKLFKCYICDSVFFTNDKLRDHFVEEHKSMEKVFACNQCEYNSFRFAHIKDHMLTHNTDKHLYCYLCKKNFEDLDECLKHFLVSHKKILQQTPNRQGIQRVNKKEETSSNNNLKKILKQTPNRQDTERVNKKEETSSNNNLTDSEENLTDLKSSFVAKTIIVNNIYQCNGCLYKFVNYENLAIHKKGHLNVLAPYKCRICAFESLCAIEIRKHLLTHGGHSITIACNVCEKLLRARQIRPHAVLHIDDGLYCFTCSENYENTQSYKQHLSSKHGTTMSQLNACNQCSFKNLNSRVLKKHIRKYHSKRKGSNELDIYDNCKAIKQEPVNEQNDCSSNTNNLPCSTDKKTRMKTLSTNKKQKHMSMTAVRKAEIPCDDDAAQSCEKTKNSNNEMNSSKPNCFTCTFKCNKCSYQCTKVDALERHDISVHANSKHLFKCNACSWQTALLKIYIKHTTSHGGSRKYSCCYCDFTSINEMRFTNHVTKHIFKCCPYCVFKSKYFQSLKRHLSRQHKPGNEPFSCSLCPYNTARIANLSTHCIKFHPAEFASLRLPIPKNLLNPTTTNACGLCSFKHFNSHSLKRHIPRHFVNGSLSKEKILGPSRLDSPEAIKEPISIREVTSSKTDINCGMNTYYRCSQCQYTSYHRRTVSLHLFKKHGIRGGLRNCMIVKVNGLISQTKKVETEKELPTRTEAETNKTHEANQQVDLNMLTTKTGDISEVSNQEINPPKEMFSRIKTNATQSAIMNRLTPLRKFVCNFCPFRSFRLYDLKKHEDRHFTSGTIARREIEVKQVPKEIKSTTNIHQNNQEVQLKETVKTKSAISKNSNVYYCCSQCNHKSVHVKGVARHLQNIHNICGSLRNHMIIKVHGTLEETMGGGAIEVKQVPKDIKNTINVHKNKQEVQLKKIVKTKSDSSKNSNVYYSCSQCSYRSVYVKNVGCHLRAIHSICGGLRNHMIIKVHGTLRKASDKSKTVVLDEVMNSIGVTDQTKTSKTKNINSKNPVVSVPTGFKSKKVKDCYERCVKCSIHLLSPSAQIEHKRIGHKAFWDKPFSCTNPKCGSRFTVQRSLAKHLTERCKANPLRNTKDRPTCEEKGNDECSSVNHVSDDESFSCGECDYVTFDVTDLIQHMFIHSGITDD